MPDRAARAASGLDKMANHSTPEEMVEQFPP